MTSQQLGDRTTATERYAREWLGLQVAGKYVKYKSATCRYSLAVEGTDDEYDGNSIQYDEVG